METTERRKPRARRSFTPEFKAEIVCAINQALLDGILRGLGDQRIQAELAPRPGACCVELRGPGARR